MQGGTLPPGSLQRSAARSAAAHLLERELHVLRRKVVDDRQI
jgi:hypothetical protein